MTRETDSIFSTLGARRGGHGARTRLAAGGSPVDSPSGEPSGAEIGRARPARKRPAGRKKHDFTLLYIYSTYITCLTSFTYTSTARPCSKDAAVNGSYWTDMGG